ncbi:MAG: hypothetical protein A3J48_00050 [Candidatus Doudnabacteria bacterium RIFCSPHIGHO2_02_FULL_46_11]|uniref:DUF2062 domain-containing protein n=1 Tax=Candidatus Doudnabacteria bacterium RIFCSPHIGHO2_02_FULL_46_11 TaxID=1817832 RepID=A0A1F5P9C7_9BACT|nr:MAG: hypothetical protein A3J48_00050 [Candidatus Doudnabacteria bacterium RIFCSPHIGHO2_02_FULL_46_11]
MLKLNAWAFANTFAIIDLILHPLFRLWVLISPESYVKVMHLFVEGLQLKIEPAFDLNFGNFLTSTILEAALFWILGWAVAHLYNKLNKSKLQS